MSSSPRSPWWRWIINTQTKRLSLVFTTATLAFTAGCRQDMHNQPKFYPQRGTTLFADGRSVRPQVENTVARGQLHEDSYFYSGLTADGTEGNVMPFPVTMDVMARGQERYNIYCTPCHSRVGNGVGMIVQRGYAQAGNFHTVRLQTAPLGHFFSVITHGYGAMPNYAAQVAPADRWAIVAYIRALQLSQNATEADVPGGAHVEPLADISEREGFPRQFASEWALPPTAVTGTKDNQPYVLPVPAITAGSTPDSGEFPSQGNLGRSAFQQNAGNPITSYRPQAQDSTGYPPSPPIPGPSAKQ